MFVSAGDAVKAPLAPRVTTATSSATPTPNADTTDLYSLTAQAAAAAFATPTGTPVNGQPLVIRIKDNATAQALTWSAGYVGGGVALPSTTVLSKILTIQFRYNTDNALNKWQCLWVAQEDAVAGGGGGAVVQTITLTGTQNDVALTTGLTLLRVNNATLVTITGLSAGTDGQRIDVVAIGAGTVVLTDQGAGSVAANRTITGESGPLVLPAGTGRARLTYDATTARWRVLIPVPTFRCSAWNSATQSVPASTFTVLTFDSEDYDVGGLHSTVTNTSRLTVPSGGDGLYLITASSRIV